MATISQVAARARVSRATVSRVVNGSAPVGEATAERVRRAVESLGYRPDRRAQDLSLGHARSVAIVAHSIASGLVTPMARILSESGFDVALLEAPSAQGLAGLADVVARAAGVVVHGISDEDIRAYVATAGVPIVATDPGQFAVDRVFIDLDPAISEIARHLAANGHHVAALFDEGSLTNSRVADLRLLFGRHGVRLIRPSRQLDNLAAALGGRDRPTAVVAATPLIALRTSAQARALGYLIPHELSIVALGRDAASEAMGMSAVAEPTHQAAQLVTDHVSWLMASAPRVRPGIEIRLRATYVPGVTTRRMGDRRSQSAPRRSH